MPLMKTLQGNDKMLRQRQFFYECLCQFCIVLPGASSLAGPVLLQKAT